MRLNKSILIGGIIGGLVGLLWMFLVFVSYPIFSIGIIFLGLIPAIICVLIGILTGYGIRHKNLPLLIKCTLIGCLFGLVFAILDILITGLITGVSRAPFVFTIPMFFLTSFGWSCKSGGCWGLLGPLILIGILLFISIGALMGVIIYKIKAK